MNNQNDPVLLYWSHCVCYGTHSPGMLILLSKKYDKLHNFSSFFSCTCIKNTCLAVQNGFTRHLIKDLLNNLEYSFLFLITKKSIKHNITVQHLSYFILCDNFFIAHLLLLLSSFCSDLL